jgi:hypothetical protein
MGGEEQITVEKRKEQAESLRHCKTSHSQLVPSNGLPGAQRLFQPAFFPLPSLPSPPQLTPQILALMRHTSSSSFPL